MSINRLMLRLATVNALTNFMEAPYPTVGDDRIFDSRIEPLENIKNNEIYPMSVVYTDYDKDHFRHGHKNAEKRLLTLTIELLAAQLRKSNDGYAVHLPHTDSELETALDIFETQTFHALAADNEAAEAWRYLVHGYDAVISRRGASVDGGQRLCARQITLECHVIRDPAQPAVPEPIEKFLARLEVVDDYRDRVQPMRDLYTAWQGLTAPERAARIMGLTKIGAGALGYTPGPAVTLGTPVIWLNSVGGPLP